MSKGKRRKCCCLLHEEIIHCHPQTSMILSFLAASCMSVNWSQTYMPSQRGWWVISVMWKLFLCLFQSILSFILCAYRQRVARPANCSATFPLGRLWLENKIDPVPRWTLLLTIWSKQTQSYTESLQRSQVSVWTHWPHAYCGLILKSPLGK